MSGSRPSLGAALLSALLAASSCVDGGDPTGVAPQVDVGLALLASFSSASSSAPAAASRPAPLTHAVIVARSAADGTVLGRSRTPIDSAAPEWSLEVTVEIPSDRTVKVVLLVELLSVQGETEVVEWSGRTGELSVSAALPTPEVRKVHMYRGPPANLDVSSVAIQTPGVELTEGDSVRLTATAEGSQEARIYFSSLDPEVATITVDGLVTTLSAGMARIRAESGPRADTLLLPVAAFPLPPQEEVEVLTPALEDGVGRIGPHLEDQASAAAIVSALGEVTSALGQGKGLAASRALERAWEALRNYGDAGSRYRDGPELSLVELLLIHMERLLAAGS